MLTPKFRLTGQKTFKQIYQKGKKDYSGFFRICYQKNDLKYSRFSIVVSLKVSKLATKRNSIKRQTRDIIRLNLSRISLDYDVIVSVLPRALGRDYDKLQQDLIYLFKKNNLI